MLFVQQCTVQRQLCQQWSQDLPARLPEQTPASTGAEPLTSASSVHFLSLFLIAVTCSEASCAKTCIAKSSFSQFRVPWHISIRKWAPLLRSSWMVPVRTGLSSIWSWNPSWKVQCFQSMQKALSPSSDDLDVSSLCLIRATYATVLRTQTCIFKVFFSSKGLHWNTG